MRYGVPYKGSKNGLAQKIVDVLPPAENFYDVFAGGCAITHCAMMQNGGLLGNKWHHFHANDISPYGVQLFYGAIRGKYKNEKRWISREDFYLLKDTDPYARLCWSFGNNGANYLYSKDIEPYKKALFEMLLSEDLSERRVKYRAVIRELFAYLNGMKKNDKSNTVSLQRLQSLESLERLQSLESLQSLEIISLDYRDVKIKPNSVIYCDPPYKNTLSSYSFDFDYDVFYSWCEEQTESVYISEYSMPEERFKVVAEWRKPILSTNTGTGGYALEKLYTVRK